MNLILLHLDDFQKPNEVVLKGRRFQHMVNIMRIKVGDVLQVGLLNEKMGRGKILNVGDHELYMSIVLDRNPPTICSCTLVMALPRPLVFKRILFSATSMGVKHIIFCQTSRVEKSFWSSPVLKKENVDEQIILGLEQSKDTIFPRVDFYKSFKHVIENVLPDISVGKSCFIAHPDSTISCPYNVKDSVVLAIGPEGGFVCSEVNEFKNRGFQSITFGPRILKVEAAMISLISKISRI